MKNIKMLNPEFVSVDLVVKEAISIMNRIDVMYSPHEKLKYVYIEVVQRFGAWRTALAKLIKKECRDVVQARFNFTDDVGKLPPILVRTRTKIDLSLIEGIKKILDRALDEIGKHQERGEFRSDKPDYFNRYGLKIDLAAAFIEFTGPSKKKRATLKRGGYAFLVFELLLKKRGKFVTYKELLIACGINERLFNEEKGMDIFKTAAEKLREVGIGPRKLKKFIETNKGYRLILKETW